jgi:hypothetical protein
LFTHLFCFIVECLIKVTTFDILTNNHKITMRSFLLGLIIILLCQKVLPQEPKEIVENLSAGKIFTSEKELKEWIALCGNDTICLFKCLNNSKLDSLSAEKLSTSLYLVKNLSSKHSSRKVKEAAVNLFFTTSKSRYSGVSSLSFKALISLPVGCYDITSIDSISSLIANHPLLYKDAVLLAGYVGNPIFIERINSLFPNARNFTKQERWATYKALARLGDKDALNYCINRVSSIPLSDQVIDVLYPDLIYIHKREAFEVMIKALYSDEPLCTSANPNSDSKIICGYRIMELLALAITDFPVKVLPSGDLDTKDYKQALIVVRNWFDKNRNSFVIK